MPRARLAIKPTASTGEAGYPAAGVGECDDVVKGQVRHLARCVGRRTGEMLTLVVKDWVYRELQSKRRSG